MNTTSEGVKLQVGDQAPAFVLADSEGNTVRLSDYKDSFVLLAFMRYAGCPWCNLALHRLALEYPLLNKSGCKVVAVVQSTPDNIQKHIYGRQQPKPPFPIIGDQGRELYDQYGVQTSVRAAVRSVKEVPYWLRAVFKHNFKQTEVDGNLLLVPAFFLVSPHDQKIVKAVYGTSFYDHTTFTDIYEHLTFEKL